MRDEELVLREKTHSAKPNMEMDLDEVIRSLEEAAQEIEKVDWEDCGRTSNDAERVRDLPLPFGSSGLGS